MDVTSRSKSNAIVRRRQESHASASGGGAEDVEMGHIDAVRCSNPHAHVALVLCQPCSTWCALMLGGATCRRGQSGASVALLQERFPAPQHYRAVSCQFTVPAVPRGA